MPFCRQNLASRDYALLSLNPQVCQDWEHRSAILKKEMKSKKVIANVITGTAETIDLEFVHSFQFMKTFCVKILST